MEGADNIEQEVEAIHRGEGDIREKLDALIELNNRARTSIAEDQETEVRPQDFVENFLEGFNEVFGRDLSDGEAQALRNTLNNDENGQNEFYAILGAITQRINSGDMTPFELYELNRITSDVTKEDTSML